MSIMDHIERMRVYRWRWKLKNPDKCRIMSQIQCRRKNQRLRDRKISMGCDPDRRIDYGTGLGDTFIKASFQKRLRLAAFQKLGGKCIRCGFSDNKALQLDHINGGGTQSGKSISWSIRYKSVLSGSLDYQLLCANCNWIKRADMNEATGRPRKPK